MSWNIQTPPVPNRQEYPFVGTVKAHGLTIHLENLKGSVRKGKGWKTKMKHHYGEILGTRGVDRDKLDVYLGPNPKSKKVFVVHQNNPKTEKYDEDKVMLGFDSAEAAKKGYLSQYNSPRFFRSMTEWKLDDFKKKIFGENRGEKVADLSDVRNEALRADLERAMATYDTVKDKSHGRPHVENVIRAARLLNQEFRLPRERVTAAAALHDIGNPVDRKRHHIIGAELAPRYLGAMNPRSRAAVIHAIREHRYSSGRPKSNLARMINDADTLSDFTTENDPNYFFRRLVEYRKSKGMAPEAVSAEALSYSRPWLQRALGGGLRTQQALNVFKTRLQDALEKTEDPKAFREFLHPMIEQEYKKAAVTEVAQKPETKNGPGKAYGDDIRKMVGAKKKKPPAEEEKKDTAYRIGEEIAKRFLAKSSEAQTEYLTKIDDPVDVPLPGKQKKPPKTKSPTSPAPPDSQDLGLPSKTAGRVSLLYRALQDAARRQATRQAAHETQMLLDQVSRFATRKTSIGELKDEIRDVGGIREQEHPVKVEVTAKRPPKALRE